MTDFTDVGCVPSRDTTLNENNGTNCTVCAPIGDADETFSAAAQPPRTRDLSPIRAYKRLEDLEADRQGFETRGGGDRYLVTVAPVTCSGEDVNSKAEAVQSLAELFAECDGWSVFVWDRVTETGEWHDGVGPAWTADPSKPRADAGALAWRLEQAEAELARARKTIERMGREAGTTSLEIVRARADRNGAQAALDSLSHRYRELVWALAETAGPAVEQQSHREALAKAHLLKATVALMSHALRWSGAVGTDVGTQILDLAKQRDEANSDADEALAEIASLAAALGLTDVDYEADGIARVVTLAKARLTCGLAVVS